MMNFRTHEHKCMSIGDFPFVRLFVRSSRSRFWSKYFEMKWMPYHNKTSYKGVSTYVCPVEVVTLCSSFCLFVYSLINSSLTCISPFYLRVFSGLGTCFFPVGRGWYYFFRGWGARSKYKFDDVNIKRG